MHPNPLRLLAATLLNATLAVTLVAPAQAHGGPSHGGRRPGCYPDQIALPDGFLPEGIAIGNSPVAYLGSRADGDIYAADLRTGHPGRLVDTLTSPNFDVPSTVAAYRGSLYLPNARFTSPQLPTTEFSITRIDR